MNPLIYWCKWITSYFYTMIYRRSIKRRFDTQDVDVDFEPYTADFLPHPEETTLETPLPESQLITTADEISFYGVNSKSEYLIIQMTRGTNQEAEAMIYLKLSNGKIYQLAETGFQQAISDNRVFSCGGLQIHYLCPMRRWRIFFNGLLNETDENGLPTDKKVHVKFALLWLASTNAYDFRTDVNWKALSTSLAKATWNQRTPPLKKLFSALDFYAQGGNIIGTLSIDGNEDSEIYLFGEKFRSFGDISSMKGMKFSSILGHVHKNGRFLHIIELSLENVVERLVFGFATVLTGGMRPINDRNCCLEKFVSEDIDIESTFQTAGQVFRLKGTINENQSISLNDSEGYFKIDCLDFELISLSQKEKKSPCGKELNPLAGGKIGRGIVTNGKIKKISRQAIPESPSILKEPVPPLVAPFSEKICQNSEITGGKGSSLGKLTELSKDIKGFVVPKGVVVTTEAYELFVTNDILKGIKKLENVLYQNKVDEAKVACQKLIEIILETPMPDQIFQSFSQNFRTVFPNGKKDDQFAVRSSATGEDTEQMSAAGQMETFLGVTGISNIMTAIKKCWASQFGYIAVQYKRQNGQMINTPMAVVVQEMVSCDVAGVLFTCDPLTGNPTNMSITANYGLGESVVSASAEPDMIEIERTKNGKLAIKNKVIGTKSHKIVLTDKGGTIVQEIGANEKQNCCLSDNAALQLSHIAILIEKACKSYRDIEWGFWKNNLYIFQSRPVTSGAAETDFEIDHEFDNALHCEEEYITFCNVGEVLPGASTPFSLDFTMKYFKTVFQGNRYMSYYVGELPKYYSRFVGTTHRHFMAFCIDFFKIASVNVSYAEALGLAFFSKILNEEELFEMAKERYSDDFGKLFDLKMYTKETYRILYGAKQQLKKTTKTYKNYTLSSVKYNNSQEMFDNLLHRLSDVTLVTGQHWIITDCSSFLNMVIFLVLQKSAGEINTDVYNDFSRCLKGGEVESADVPASMERLASYITKDIDIEEFKKMNTKEAVKRLENSATNAGKKYREFIKKHGHRCLREFDLSSLTWETNPEPLVKLLQSLAGTAIKKRSEEKTKTCEEIISELKTPLSYRSKLLLRLILPMSRSAVQNRECTKSILIRIINEFRNGFRNLAKLMVLEGRLPDEDLFFFMTLDEVKELLETRSPRIISKANHRRRRQPILDKYKFQEIVKGFPKPMNAGKKIEVKIDGDVSLKGIPVSQGEATGIVRVALDLEEASQLQPGEILVTYSTDIGWSPYFPILGGVVTEIGGLISHGAVISREYGLPCIAGLTGATQYFKTGDFVLLNGTKGILQKIKKPEDS